MSRSFLNPIAICALAAGISVCGLSPVQAEVSAQTSTPKNVIVLIGDGMGYNYLDLYNAYHTNKVHYQVETGGDHKAIHYEGNAAEAAEGFQSWNQLGMQTYWAGGVEYNPQLSWGDFDWNKDNPTDSAAAGTAMATGVKTYNAGVGVDEDEVEVENLAERAKALGKSAGVVSSVQYSHATPATYSVHNVDRNNYTEIAHSQLISELDVVMGAGHPFYDDNHQRLETGSFKYITKEDYEALSAGSTDFDFVEDDAAFEQLTSGKTPDRVFGIAQVATTLQQARTDESTLNDVVDLSTMTRGALNVLDNDDDGLFLMVEGGAIDWTGHSNQTERALTEVEDFFEAVDAVNEWVETNSSWDETLVIVTADHETGYMMGDPEGGFNPMQPQGVGEYPALSWNSTNHTNQLAPFFFRGAGSDALAEATIGRDQIRGRYLDNTATARWLLDTAWVQQKDNAEATASPSGNSNEEPTAVAFSEEPATPEESADEPSASLATKAAAVVDYGDQDKSLSASEEPRIKVEADSPATGAQARDSASELAQTGANNILLPSGIGAAGLLILGILLVVHCKRARSSTSK